MAEKENDQKHLEEKLRDLPVMEFRLEHDLGEKGDTGNPYEQMHTGEGVWPIAFKIRLGEQYLPNRKGGKYHFSRRFYPPSLLRIAHEIVGGGEASFDNDEGGFNSLEITVNGEDAILSFTRAADKDGKYAGQEAWLRGRCKKEDVIAQFLNVYNALLYDLHHYGEEELLREELRGLMPDRKDSNDEGRHQQLFYRFRDKLEQRPFIMEHADIYRKAAEGYISPERLEASRNSP